ncbi:MAG: hypothetical protein WCY32_00355 [Burkholderiaceae bacterium]
MLHPVLRGLVAAFVAMLVGATAASAQQAGVLRVKRVPVMDDKGFEKPLPALTMLVPMHWQTEGGVVWGQSTQCNSAGYNFAFNAFAPDRSFGAGILPIASWSAYHGIPPPNNGCPVADLRNAKAFLQWYAGRILPGARVIDFRARPDLLRGMEALVSRTPYGNGAYSETGIDAGEVLLAYSENGRDMRGTMAAVVVLWHSHFPGSPSLMAGLPGTPDLDIFGGSSMPAFGAFAPAGQLDTRTAEMIRKSVQPVAEWSRRIAEHQAVINRQNRKGAIDRHNIRMRTISEVGDIINQGYRNRIASQDRIQREVVESIRGVETYNDPYHGGTVELDNTYRNAWQLNDGSYVLTDDESFNPYAAFGQDGRRLEVTR